LPSAAALAGFSGEVFAATVAEFVGLDDEFVTVFVAVPEQAAKTKTEIVRNSSVSFIVLIFGNGENNFVRKSVTYGRMARQSLLHEHPTR
jgi:hypothetical protein